MSRHVLDASAVLALLLAEPGGDVVAKHLGDGCISAVNWSEVLAKQVRMGQEPEQALAQLHNLNLAVVPFDVAAARTSGLLEASVRALGLGSGDRACLALGKLLDLPVLTADRTWAQLRLGVVVRVVR